LLLRPATSDDGNVRACVSGGESHIPHGPLKDRSNLDKSEPASTHTDEISADPHPSPIFNPEHLIGRTFLMDEKEDGQKRRGQMLS
jgi:hypothetical protein